MSTGTSDRIEEAKKLVRRHVNQSYALNSKWVTIEDIKVLWDATLGQDWMVFLSVAQLEDRRYSVMYSSDAKDTIIDSYTMVNGASVLDEE